MLILYNDSYGGFHIPYGYIAAVLGEEFKITHFRDINKRTHPKIVALVNTFPEKFPTIRIAYIPDEYRNSYEITEYDGLEGIRILLDKYKVEKIKQLLTQPHTDEEILAVCNETSIRGNEGAEADYSALPDVSSVVLPENPERYRRLSREY